MAEDLKPGDRVTWKSHGDEAHDKVVKRQTSRTRIGAHAVAASEERPQFIVETDEGKRAAHKSAALTRE